MDLFAETEAAPQEVPNDDDLFEEGTPEEIAKREADMQAAREALGLDKADRIMLETKEDLERALRKRLHIVAELEEAKRAALKADSQLKSWTYLFGNQCQAYYDLNPPKTGKTITTVVGSLSSRSVAANYALDAMDEDELRLGEFLTKQSKELQTKWGVKAVPKMTYARDINAIKKHFMTLHTTAMDEWKEACKLADAEKRDRPQRPSAPVVPGLKFSQQRESFSIKQGSM